MNRQTNQAASTQIGFTLVEVLVALVVLSIGLLGVAKLVLSAARSDDSAYMRSQATQLANAMMDEMRANQAAAVAGAYTYVDTSVVTTPGSFAQTDVYNWQQRLALALPSGKGSITVTPNTPAAGSTFAQVTVSWDDNIGKWANGQASTINSGLTTLTLQSQL